MVKEDSAVYFIYGCIRHKLNLENHQKINVQREVGKGSGLSVTVPVYI